MKVIIFLALILNSAFAQIRISMLPESTVGTTASNDLLMMVDIDATTTKKITFDEFDKRIKSIVNVDNLRLDGNTISSTNTNGGILLTPNGTGNTKISNNLAIGDATTATGTKLDIWATNSSAGIRVNRISDNSSAPFLILQKGRTDAYPLSGDGLFSIQTRSYRDDTEAYASAASTVMATFTTEAHSTSETGRDIRLYTVENGTTTTSERLRIGNNGNVLIGTTTDAPSAILNLTSTTKGFLPPRMTTAQRDAITAVAGLIIYNTTTNKHQGYNGTIWNDFF